MKDDLNGLDKAVSAMLGERTIERNLLLVKVAKSKLARRRDDKNDKVTKPEELVRLYDLLLQVDIHIFFLCKLACIFLCKDSLGSCIFMLFSSDGMTMLVWTVDHVFGRIQLIFPI